MDDYTAFGGYSLTWLESAIVALIIGMVIWSFAMLVRELADNNNLLMAIWGMVRIGIVMFGAGYLINAFG